MTNNAEDSSSKREQPDGWCPDCEDADGTMTSKPDDELSWDDRDRILIEVTLGVPEAESKVKPTPAAIEWRRQTKNEIDEMKAQGIMPMPLKD